MTPEVYFVNRASAVVQQPCLGWLSSAYSPAVGGRPSFVPASGASAQCPRYLRAAAAADSGERGLSPGGGLRRAVLRPAPMAWQLPSQQNQLPARQSPGRRPAARRCSTPARAASSGAAGVKDTREDCSADFAHSCPPNHPYRSCQVLRARSKRLQLSRMTYVQASSASFHAAYPLP